MCPNGALEVFALDPGQSRANACVWVPRTFKKSGSSIPYLDI
jgi:hypothetical protein